MPQLILMVYPAATDLRLCHDFVFLFRLAACRTDANQADALVAATSVLQYSFNEGHTQEATQFVSVVKTHPCHCRAYKLGKKRWSYNQCELVLTQQGSTSPSEVTAVEAVHNHGPAMHSNVSGSQVSMGVLCSNLPGALACIVILPGTTCDMTLQASYDVKLSNNQTVHVAVFLVHSSPDAEVAEESSGDEQKVYQWKLISRSK